MNAEQLAILRAPFAKGEIGQLPKITCKACTDSKIKVCADHKKEQCKGCGNYITSRHTHLDYVGHAAATNRLLAADPDWSWEPMSYDADGLPAFDRNGGLWIKLTVCGTTRPGYGHPDGKSGGNAVKEAIGDAIRNAAMRFGVAVDLWHKGTLSGAIEPTSDAYEAPPSQPATATQLRSVPDDGAEAPSGPQETSQPARTVIRRQTPEATGDSATPAQVRKLSAMFGGKGWDDAAIDAFVEKVSGGRTTSRLELTKSEASKAIELVAAS